MKMIFTEKETNAIVGAIKAIVTGISESSAILGEKVDASILADGITDEKIKEFNKDTKGVITITKDNGLITIDYNEDFVVSTVGLAEDFVVDFFDVIKYGIKTFIAFGAVKITAYKEKILSLMK